MHVKTNLNHIGVLDSICRMMNKSIDIDYKTGRVKGFRPFDYGGLNGNSK